MNSVKGVLSKLKDGLESIINDCKNSVSEIVKEEEFIQSLGDIVNYSKSDCLLLPFYDETILSRVIDRVFPSGTYAKKIKTAKYLIEASKSVDKENFLQYNNAVKELEKINDKLGREYNDMLANDDLKNDKEKYNEKISLYNEFLDKIGEDQFLSLISDVDLFKEIVDLCEFNDKETNALLNLAIKCNLTYLDGNGVISEEEDVDIIDMKNDNYKMQEEIKNLSNLLGDE